ncbi:MAG: S9 family peptidase [Balneolaceae bacterium]|nr:S9 family peptidase [Balneolaceae bacterium]
MMQTLLKKVRTALLSLTLLPGLVLVMNLSALAQLGGGELHNPTFEEVLSLKGPSDVRISPNGRHVLYRSGAVEWDDNRYDSELWLSKNGNKPFQLTNNVDGSSSSAAWSPDGRWILFQRSLGDKSRIFVINPEGGEAHPLMYIDKSVQGFELSPDGSTLAFRVQDEPSEEEKTIEERYGDYAVDNEDYRLTRLYTVAFDPHYAMNEPVPCMQDTTYTTCPEAPEVKAHLEDAEFTITGGAWSPDGSKIIINHQPDPIITSFLRSDISLYDPETEEITTLVDNESADSFLEWSPEGDAFLYVSSVDNDSTNFFTNNRYFIYDLESGNTREVAAGFDENLNSFTWTEQGIYATAYRKTTRPLLLLNPENGEVSQVYDGKRLIYDVSISDDGKRVAIRGRDGDELNEVYLGSTGNFELRKLTDYNSQLTGWATVQSEVISWESKDGAVIEGVLHKPQDYDPSKKYPLLVAIHGGPTGISLPDPAPAYVYPIVQWVNKGALVLRPNYRGSAGYGEEFRSLNVRNLGVGDAWDVLSGVDHLAEEGLIDTTKLGTMGWSQGGYISAFLATYSNRFDAASVGAGISNWVTYYVNTDIHPFTRQYLKATPWEDMDIYEKTSPMTYINNATTPTLIQHGENDRRVPIPNAYELLQGLQDMGVDAKLIVYEGFGHGITKPKERLAAMWHNWQWFGKYLWNEEIELPTK